MVRLRRVSLAALLVAGDRGLRAGEERQPARAPTSPVRFRASRSSAPKPLEPRQGAQVVKNGEPLTLIAENAELVRAAHAVPAVRDRLGRRTSSSCVHHADRVEPGAERPHDLSAARAARRRLHLLLARRARWTAPTPAPTPSRRASASSTRSSSRRRCRSSRPATCRPTGRSSACATARCPARTASIYRFELATRAGSQRHGRGRHGDAGIER